MMDKKEIKELLQKVKSGEISEEDAVLKLRMDPVSNIGYARIDNHRALRTGAPEVIYGEGKTAGQISGIVSSMLKSDQKQILITRLSEEKKNLVQELLDKDKETVKIEYNPDGKTGFIGEKPKADGLGKILVISAGTSDIPVCEEAAVTCEAFGNEVERLYDVGVAGLSRLISNLESLMKATVIIAVAGMEGALPTVVNGLVDCPVIAVPTSVGYGTAFQGISALLTMLNSCSSGLCVQNIDNGFGAACLASRINHMKIS